MPAFQVLWPRWRQLTSTAAHRGVLCFGPDRGRNVTYTNPHRWLPGFVPDDADAAVRTLIRAYLHAYGPATPQHFAKWLNVPPKRAVDAFDAMADELERVALEGKPAWVVAGDLSEGGADGRRGDPPAAVLRRVRRGGPTARAAVSRRCRVPGR